LSDKEQDLQYCVVIPTYNNAQTLEAVIDGVAQHSDNILIVNDGSTDQTTSILGQYPNYNIISHPYNQGKGMALRNAFDWAHDKGFDYAITIDSDAQHDPADIPSIVEKVKNNSGAVVMGSRNMGQEGIPKKSSFGNKFSSFWFWAETGISLSDTQTGFRAYPLAPMKGMRWYTKRFEFEIESIVRLAWKNIKFVEQPVSIQYQEDRVSHFRPVQDFAKISLLNTVLFILALLYFLPRLFIRNFSISGLWRQITSEFSNYSGTPFKLAGSVGLGLCSGILPIWGFQMLFAGAVASILRLNRIIVLAASNISIPPMIPIIVYLSFRFGALFVSDPVEITAMADLSIDSIQLQLRQYIIGSFLLAISVGGVGFIITWILSTVIKKIG